jgi:hypothetical protein
MRVNFFFKLLGAKKRNEIRRGKLWEITRLWGIDIFKSEKEVAKPEPRKKREGGDVESLRPHTLKPLDNVANMTKKADLL